MSENRPKPYLGNPQETIAVLNRYKFAFQKKFGQNFLIDTHVLETHHRCGWYYTGRFCAGNRTGYRYHDPVSCLMQPVRLWQWRSTKC